MSIKIGVGLNTGSIDQQISAIENRVGGVQRKVNKLSDAIATANQSLGQTAPSRAATSSPSSGGAASQQRKQTADSEAKLLRAQEELNKLGLRYTREQTALLQKGFSALSASGARGTKRLRGMDFEEFISSGWQNYSTNDSESRRFMRDTLKRSAVLGGADFPADAFGHDGGSDAAPSNGQKRNRRFDAAAGALGGMAANFLTGGGGMWGAAGSATGSLVGMAAGGPWGMVAGAILGGVGSALDRQINQIGGEGEIYTDLRQSLGATTTDFDMLRSSVRHLSDGLGIAYNESAKLASEFSKSASLTSADGLGADLRQAGGWGRGYGINPSEAVRFMGGMRHLGVTGDDKDSRRLALMIAEAVNQGGIQARMSEALGVISNYASNQSRASLTSPDVANYSAFLSSMTGSGFFGIKGDPAAAAAIMGKADAALRSGGGFGEASKNFSLAAYQNLFGKELTAYDAEAVYQQGAFGDLGKAFDPLISLAKQRGDAKEVERLQLLSMRGQGKNSLSLNLDYLDKQFGHLEGTAFAKNGASHLGMSVNEFSAIYGAYKKDSSLGGLESTLRASGVDIKGMNDRQIASLAALVGGDDAAIRRQADALGKLSGRDALKEKERMQLDAARSDPNTLRDTVLQLSAKHATSSDQGDQMRNMSADVNNILQELATKLVPLTMNIKDIMVEVLRFFDSGNSFVDAEDKRRAVAAKEKAEAGRLDMEIKESSSKIDNFHFDTAEEQQAKAAQLVALRNAQNSALADGDKSRAASYDSAIEQITASLRSGTGAGLEDLKRKHDDLVSRRNAIESQPAGYVRYSDNEPAENKGTGRQFVGKSDFMAQSRQTAEAAAAEINRRTGSSVTPEMIQAQWGLETGWGKSMTGDFNFGNIKSGKGWSGRTRELGGVLEYGPNGEKNYRTESFRSYSSASEAGADYANLVSGRYLKGRRVQSADEFYRALKEQGYATDPDYVSKLSGAYRNLPSNAMSVPDNAVPRGGSSGNPQQAVNVNVNINSDPIRIADSTGQLTGQQVPLNTNFKVQPFGGRP